MLGSGAGLTIGCFTWTRCPGASAVTLLLQLPTPAAVRPTLFPNKANCRRRKASRFHCLTRPLTAIQRHLSMPSSAALSHLLDSVWHHHSDPPRKPPCKPDRRSLLLPEETRIRRLLQLYADSELHRLNRPEVLQVATADSFFCPPLSEDLLVPTVLRHAPARTALCACCVPTPTPTRSPAHSTADEDHMCCVLHAADPERSLGAGARCGGRGDAKGPAAGAN